MTKFFRFLLPYQTVKDILYIYTELSHVLNRYIFNRLSSLTSVAEGGEYP